MGIHDLRDTRVNSGISCFATFHHGSRQNRRVLLVWVGSMSVSSVFKNGAVATLACLGTLRFSLKLAQDQRVNSPRSN